MKSFIRILVLAGGMHWAAAQSLIPNGDFEAFLNGIPTGWTYSGYSGSPSLDEKTIVSPFHSIYSISRNSLKFVSGQGGSFYGSFTSQSGALVFSFDFLLGSGTIGTNNYWFMELQGGGLTHNLFEIGYNEQLRILDNSGTVNTSISRNTWYHLSLSLDGLHNSYSISLTSFGGATLTWSNRTPMNIVDLSRVYLTNWTSWSANAPLYLDNMAIVAVPEPRGIKLIIFALGVLALVRLSQMRCGC